jgi:hypothetical protein
MLLLGGGSFCTILIQQESLPFDNQLLSGLYQYTT